MYFLVNRFGNIHLYNQEQLLAYFIETQDEGLPVESYSLDFFRKAIRSKFDSVHVLFLIYIGGILFDSLTLTNDKEKIVAIVTAGSYHEAFSSDNLRDTLADACYWGCQQLDWNEVIQKIQEFEKIA